MGCYFIIGVVLVLVGRVLVKLFYKDKRSEFVRSALAALEEDKTPQEKRREFFKSSGGSLTRLTSKMMSRNSQVRKRT